MLKFDEKKQIDSVNGALALKGEIEKIVDEIYDSGFDGIYWVASEALMPAPCRQRYI